MVGWEQGMFQSEIALFFSDYLISDHEPIGPPLGHRADSLEGNGLVYQIAESDNKSSTIGNPCTASI